MKGNIISQNRNMDITTLTPEDMNIRENDEVSVAFFNIDKEYSALFDLVYTPKRIEGCGLCFCINGEGEFIMDDKSYIIKKNDMCVVFPKTTLQVIGRSDDFVGYVLATNTDFIKNLRVPGTMDMYIFIKENPCISISDNQLDMFMKMLSILNEKNEKSKHPYRKQMVESLLLTICYEIAALYHEKKPIEKHIHSRQEMLFRKFVFLLYTEEPRKRNVAHYANKLFVTPKYLSMIVKNCSGGSAADWIKRFNILDAKTLLVNTDLTIQQISDKLDFPNPSFFGQYFKRNVGITPKDYRNNR